MPWADPEPFPLSQGSTRQVAAVRHSHSPQCFHVGRVGDMDPAGASVLSLLVPLRSWHELLAAPCFTMPINKPDEELIDLRVA